MMIKKVYDQKEFLKEQANQVCICKALDSHINVSGPYTQAIFLDTGDNQWFRPIFLISWVK